MQEVNGTFYHDGTLPVVIELLEACRASKTRIRVAYGDSEGQDWGDIYGTVGYVSRSIGPMKVPLLVYNRRSIGGDAISDSRIVRIETTSGRRVLYQHPNYKPPKEV